MAGRAAPRALSPLLTGIYVNFQEVQKTEDTRLQSSDQSLEYMHVRFLRRMQVLRVGYPLALAQLGNPSLLEVRQDPHREHSR